MSDLKDIWNSGKGKLPEDKLLAYLEGRLSPEEQHEVEQWFAEEGMESDAEEGLDTLPAEETRKMVGKLNAKLHTELKKKRVKRNKLLGDNHLTWIAIFVIFLLCILAYTVIHYITK